MCVYIYTYDKTDKLVAAGARAAVESALRPGKLRLVLESLGPAFVKLGQAMPGQMSCMHRRLEGRISIHLPIYLPIYLSIYVYIHTFSHSCIKIYLYLYAYTHAYMYVGVYIYVWAHTHASIYIYIDLCKL